MITELGFNIKCSTAKEQYLFDNSRESKQYYEEQFQYTLYKQLLNIIRKYFDCEVVMEIETDIYFLKDGKINNTILLIISTDSINYNKKELRKEIQLYINDYFINLFKKEKAYEN